MNKKKKAILIVALLLVVFIGSISYALWSVTLEQTDSNIVKTGCFTVDMVEQTDEINLPEEYPVLDSEGKTYTPFTFTIQNTCTIDSSYSVNLNVDAATTLEHEYVKVSLNNDAVRVLTNYEKATNEDKYQLTTGTLAGASSEGAGDGESVTYNLRLWLDQDTPKTQMGKDFIAKVVVENITISESRNLLGTTNASDSSDDNVTLYYYDDGHVILSGTGKTAESYLPLLISVMTAATNEELASQVSGFDSLSEVAQNFAFMVATAGVGGYKSVSKAMNEAGFAIDISTVTNNDELKLVVDEFIEKDTTLFTNDEKQMLFAFNEAMLAYVVPVKSIEIEEGITIIGHTSFTFMPDVEVVLPSTVVKVETEAFTNSEVTRVVLNEGLEVIGTSTFSNSLIPNVVLPSTVKEIRRNAFNASIIDSIVLPSGVTKLNAGVFANASNLTSVVILGDVTEIDPTAFDNLSINPNLVIKFAMPEDKKTTILDSTTKLPFDFTNYNVEWGYTE